MKARREESGGVLGKVVGVLLVLALVGGGVWAVRSFMDEKEEKSIKGKYFEAKRSDFIVTVKLSGNLASTDVEILKCELEGSTTIKFVIEEGITVKGPSRYSIQSGDTLAIIAESTAQDVLDKDELNIRSLNIKLMNEDEKIDWDNLSAGEVIQIPGTLLLELDPTNLEERINSQEIDVLNAQSALVRAEGGLKTMKLSTALELKRAQNSHQNSVLELKKVQNSTVETHIKDMVGTIANLEKDVELAQKNVKAYDGLKELGFVSDVEVLKEKAKEAKTLHQIKIAQAELAAYREYDQVKLISASQLAVDEAEVTIKKTQVKNVADLNDANSTVLTAQKTLDLEIEKLKYFEEQMANTHIYAPDKGTVVYWSESSRHSRSSSSEPIMDGASVRRGQRLIKLPKTDSLKVELNIPQSSRADVRREMKAWIQVEDVILRGTVTMLAGTVDTNTRSYSNRSGFKAEVIIDDDQQIPDSVTEGMQAKVEILVKELTGKHQLIKVPNQCITSRTFSKENSETGCWVLNDNGENDWRPVIIVYHDEDYIAIEDEEVIQKCIRIIAEHGEANATKLEESLDLSSPRVERILEELGKRKVLGPRKNTDKPREILMDLTEEKIRQIPQRLRFQAAEPFEDVNNNKLWDEGEKFTDINKNGEYEKGEQVLLTPLSEADKLDLAESIENKSRVKGILGEAANKLTEKSGKTQSETPAKRGGSQSAGTMTAGHPRDSGGSQGDAGGNPYAQLDLKEDQKKKLDSARQERATGMRGLRDTPREERNAKIQELREAYEYKVEGILTPEQYKKYQEARPQRRPGQGGFDHGRRGGGD